MPVCLAVPGRIERIDGLWATVEVTGVRLQARLDLLPEAVVDDCVLVQAGFAITVIDPQQAEEIARLRREVTQLG